MKPVNGIERKGFCELYKAYRAYHFYTYEEARCILYICYIFISMLLADLALSVHKRLLSFLNRFYP